PTPPVLTGSVPQSEAMGEGTRLRVGGRQTRARPTSGAPTPSPAPPVLPQQSWGRDPCVEPTPSPAPPVLPQQNWGRNPCVVPTLSPASPRHPAGYSGSGRGSRGSSSASFSRIR